MTGKYKSEFENISELLEEAASRLLQLAGEVDSERPRAGSYLYGAEGSVQHAMDQLDEAEAENNL